MNDRLAMLCQHVGCTKKAIVVVQVEATLATRADLPMSLSGSAHVCMSHVAGVAKDLARRVTELKA